MTMSNLFGFEVQNCTNAVRIRVFGEADMAAEQPLVTATSEVLASGGCASVVLDLTGVSFMDSSGLRGVLRCRQNARAHAVPFKLAVADGPVARLLKLAGIAGQLEYE
jgi:anti-anti-sigma factor